MRLLPILKSDVLPDCQSAGRCFRTIVFWGRTAALHIVGVWGGNFLITKSDAFGSPYHKRPNGSTSEIRSTPRWSLRGQTFIPAQCKKMSRSNSGRCNLLLQPSLLPKRHNQRMAWQRLGRSSPDFSRDRPEFFSRQTLFGGERCRAEYGQTIEAACPTHK